VGIHSEGVLKAFLEDLLVSIEKGDLSFTLMRTDLSRLVSPINGQCATGCSIIQRNPFFNITACNVLAK